MWIFNVPSFWSDFILFNWAGIVPVIILPASDNDSKDSIEKSVYDIVPAIWLSIK